MEGGKPASSIAPKRAHNTSATLDSVTAIYPVKIRLQRNAEFADLTDSAV